MRHEELERYDFSAAIGDISDEHIDLFLGPMDGEEVTSFSSDTTLVDILVHFGLFASKTQARKNGWDRPFDEGFTEFRVGKKKKVVTILKEGDWQKDLGDEEYINRFDHLYKKRGET